MRLSAARAAGDAPVRLVFMGTPDFAVPVLAEISGQGHEVAAVYTRAPKPAGRGMAERPSPVETFARTLNLPVLVPKSLRSEEAAALFRAHGADVAVVVAYGLILPKPILDAPALGCLNLHASLLPRWRGAAPIQRAIMAGDAETGVAVMRMEEGLDTGPVALCERLAVTPEMTAGDAHHQLSRIGADLMARALGALARGGLRFAPQPDAGVVYAPKIEKGETRISWSQPAEAVRAHIHGLSPSPGAWFEADLGRGPERVKALRARCEAVGGAPGTALDSELLVACGTGALRLLEIQRAGKAPMRAADFLRGARLPAGARLA